MSGYPAHMGAHAPCRSLSDIAIGLRAERNRQLLRQLEAEAYGDDDIAADCLRRIEDIDTRLRAIDEARG